MPEDYLRGPTEEEREELDRILAKGHALDPAYSAPTPGSLFIDAIARQLYSASPALGALASVIIPTAPRAKKILAKRFATIFGPGTRFPKISVYRYQDEGPGEKEVFRRGGQYFLSDPPADPKTGNPTRPRSQMYDFYGGGGEGGPILKSAEVEAKNPLLAVMPAGGKGVLERLIGKNEYKRLVGVRRAAGVADAARRAGAHPRDIRNALEARDPFNSLLDLYKTQLLKRYGIDVAIRGRFSDPDLPEVFVTNPKQALKSVKFEPD